jgi:hypothetical protein
MTPTNLSNSVCAALKLGELITLVFSKAHLGASTTPKLSPFKILLATVRLCTSNQS